MGAPSEGLKRTDLLGEGLSRWSLRNDTNLMAHFQLWQIASMTSTYLKTTLQCYWLRQCATYKHECTHVHSYAHQGWLSTNRKKFQNTELLPSSLSLEWLWWWWFCFDYQGPFVTFALHINRPDGNVHFPLEVVCILTICLIFKRGTA